MLPAANNNRTAVFLDLDGTILRRESQLHFVIRCFRLGLVNRPQAVKLILRYVLYVTSMVQDASSLRDQGFRLLKGQTVSLIQREIQNFLTSFTPEIRRGVASLLAFHRRAGHHPVLVTSAMEPLARQFGLYLEIDDVIATRLHSENGVYSGLYDLPSPWGAGKRLLVHDYCAIRGFSPAACFAYSDHYSDLPLLTYVGRPVAANPHRPLAKVAAINGWPVVDLEKPFSPPREYESFCLG